MKTYEHPLFLITALSLFFPIGLILLAISNHPIKRKILFGIVGGLIFVTLLSMAFILPPKTYEINELDLIVTDKQLTIGQSGGFCVYSSDNLITDFQASANNDNIQINDNVFTAVKIGTTIVHVTASGVETEFTVTVIDGPATDSIVYLSPTGARYHSTSSHIGANVIEMTEEEALWSGKTPCKICYK